MPYEVKKDNRCPASKPWALIKKDGNEIIGCHVTKEKAEAQEHVIGMGEAKAMDEIEERAVEADDFKGTPFANLPVRDDILWSDFTKGKTDAEITDDILGDKKDDWEAMKQSHLAYAPGKDNGGDPPTQKNAYKLKIAARDPKTGKLTVIKNQLGNRMAVINGGRAGVDISESAKKEAFEHGLKYYDKLKVPKKDQPKFEGKSESVAAFRQGDVNVTVSVTVDADTDSDADADDDAGENAVQLEAFPGTVDEPMGVMETQATGTRRPDAPELYREFDVRVDRDAMASRAADDGSIPLAISSEFPVLRTDWWEGKDYNEVLDHSPASVDLSRASDGLPLLKDHDSRKQIGIVEGVRADPDRVLRGVARFSRSQDAQEVKQDMLDGIRKKISVGYRPDMNNVVRTQADDDAVPTERIMRWTPLEVSSVPIPADPTVGVGRSAGEDFKKEITGVVESALKSALAVTRAGATPRAAQPAEETTMSEKDTAAQEVAAEETLTASAGEDKAKRAERETAIRWICKQHGCEQRAEGYVESGMDPATVGRLIAAEKFENQRSMNATIDLPAPSEKRYFSVSRAIAGQLYRQGHPGAIKVDDGFEQEVDQELRKNQAGLQHVPADHGGILIPSRVQFGKGSAMERAIDTQSSTGAKGGNLIFAQPGEYLDYLWPRMKVAAAGATRLAGLTAPVKLPKLTGVSSWTWTGDNPGSDVSASDPVFGQVALDPKEGQATTGYTRAVLLEAASGNVDLEAKVQNQLFMAAALGVDSAAISGDTGGNNPVGILYTSNVGSVAGGTNGAVPTRANMIDLRTQVANANADIGPGAFLTTPGVRGVLQNVFASVGTTPVGLPVWRDDGTMLGEPAYVSTQVPSTLTKGTSSGVCHAVIYGVFETLDIGYWGAYELVVDPYTGAKQGLINVTNYQIVGVALEYPQAFAVMADALLS